MDKEAGVAIGAQGALVAQVDVGQVALAQFLRQRQPGPGLVIVAMHVVQAAERRDAHADMARADCRDEAVDGVEQQAQAIFRAAAIAVVTGIEFAIDELLEQIAVGAVYLHAIEAGLHGTPARGDKVAGDRRHFLGRQCAWCAGGDMAGHAGRRPGIGLHAVRTARHRRYRRGACLLQRHMRVAPDMPQLGENPSAGSVHRIGHAPPCLALIVGVQPGREQIAGALPRHGDAFRDDQPGRSALAVVTFGQHIGDAVGGARARHGRHHDAVGQVQACQVIRIEQLHGFLSPSQRSTDSIPIAMIYNRASIPKIQD